MFEKEPNSEELNKIMSVVCDKHDMLFEDDEQTKNIQLEKEIYQKMNLIKLEDLNLVHLKEIRRKLNRKYGKMAAEDEINEIEKNRLR